MSFEGFFRFQMGAMPEQRLELKHAKITLFGTAGAGSESLSVNVDVYATERIVAWADPDHPEDGALDHRIAPAFYTEWLDMPRAALAGRGLGAVDGLAFDYDASAPDAPPESPGAINQDSHALFQQAKMDLRHIGEGRYDVRAEGVTEFGWTFALEAVAPLGDVVFRHQDRDAQKAPSAAVEEEFDQLFDRAAFDCGWMRRGPSDNGWFDFIAKAKEQSV